MSRISGFIPPSGAAMAALVAASVLACVGCSSPPHRAAPEEFQVIRTYGWDAAVDPQAAWAPRSYRVVAREAGGFVILQEANSGKPREKFLSSEKRETHHPAWINEQEIVFGPAANALRLADGRVVPASDGLTVVTIGGLKPEQKQLSKVGYRPRVGQGHVFAQVEDRMDKIDATGEIEDFGQGFFAQPQPVGEGVCWQETPVSEPDWWTGKPVRSKLVIRWNWRRTDTVAGGSEARWSSDGGVAATVLRAEPAAGAAWDSAGTDVVFIPGPGKPAVVVAHDAREPAPHPTQPVIAVATADGRIVLVSRDGAHRVEVAEGRRPQWSHDGTRLMVEESRAPEPAAVPTVPADQHANTATAGAIYGSRPGSSEQTKRLTVYVFRF
jgi:hypothetical protein